MKHFFLILVFSTIVFAQKFPTKGDISLAGSLLITSNSNSNSSTTIIQFSPEVSYFISDNFELGTTLTFQSYQISNQTNTSIGIGPFISGYFNTENIRPFIGMSVSYLNYRDSFLGKTKNDQSAVSARVYGGMLIPINQKLAIQQIIQYSMTFGEGVGFGDVTQIMFGIGLKAFL